MSLRFISLFSGIGAPEAAWLPLGWRCIAQAEIEPFPVAVLAHRYPETPNHGDVTAFDWSIYRNCCDVLVGGSPCQSFSVAGLRKSLDDDRGNLALAFCKITHAIDPRFVVYENVPGILSTKDNAFGCLLAGLVGEGQPLVCGDGNWPNAGMAVGPVRSAAWRVLDAQYFGVAQRRRRVFVVSCRTGDGINPGAILFEPECLPGNPAPGRETGTRIAASLTRGADSGGRGGYAGRRREDDENLVAHPLLAKDNCSHDNTLDTYVLAEVPDVCPAIKSRDYKGPSSDGDGDGAILVPMVAGTLQNSGKAAGSATQQDVDSDLLVVHSLRAEGFDASEDGTGRGTYGKAADAPRYRALGNSMAVPVVRWIGQRIQLVDSLTRKVGAA